MGVGKFRDYGTLIDRLGSILKSDSKSIECLVPKSKNVGGRPRKEAEYNQGSDAARAFGDAFDAVLTVSKPRIVELEKKSKKRPVRGK